MSIKKTCYITQVFIIIGGATMIFATSLPSDTKSSCDTVEDLETMATTVRTALKSGWIMSKKNDDKLARKMAEALDEFKKIYIGFKELITLTEERKQSMVALQDSLIAEQDRARSITSLHNDLISAHAETQKAVSACNELQVLLDEERRKNNILRSEIALTRPS